MSAARSFTDSAGIDGRVKVILLVPVTQKDIASGVRAEFGLGRKLYTAMAMPVWISMLRGVNVGGHNRITMQVLRELCVPLKLEDARTYVQSGNLIFRSKEKSAALLGHKLQNAIEKEFSFRPDVILRTADEVREAIAANPFAKRTNVEPSKLLLTFLAADASKDAPATLQKFKDYPEEIHLKGRELYIYFPNGAGSSKLPWSSVERLLKTTGTARNWNTLTRMLEIAEELEAAA